MHPSLLSLDHRPWPLPAQEWRWRQSWLNLAFLHYRASAEQLRPMLPEAVRLQEFDGSPWVGLVPFRMAGVMRRPFPDLPVFSSFPELNVRTYVEMDGKPGVWFFSLDADSLSIVFGGRYIYNLPYYYSRMRDSIRDGWHDYSCHRRGDTARFRARYRPVGNIFTSRPGTFEHWATERYCLYSTSRRGIERVEVHHAPWPLQRAEVVIKESNMLEAAGITPSDPEPVCHFSPGVHVVSYGSEVVRSADR